MKIAFFTHYTELYGANRSLIGLIEGLQSLDAKIKFLVVMPNPDSEFEMILRKKKIETLVFPFAMSMQYRWYSRFLPKRPFQYLQYIKEARTARRKNQEANNLLTEKLQEWQPDLIYSNSSVFDVGYDISKRLNLAHVWHLREFGWEDYKLVFPFSDGEEHYQKIAQTTLRIAISENIARHFEAKIGNVPIEVIYNGILKKEKFLQNKQKANTNNFIFCIIGLIQTNKGQKQAVEALSLVVEKYPKTTLWIVGEGDTKNLERLIRKKNLSLNVSLRGLVSDVFEEVFPHVNATLMCSQAEAMGRVTVESMAALRPVIGRNSAGTAELIADGRGLAYDGTTEDLAQKMIFLIENPTHINKMTSQAWEWVYENFSIESYAEKIYELVLKVKDNSNPSLP
ncbi:glycosyltransferase family 4 protein [Hugenholtzia roseola]|uniref:glycosyltransferase family 4 protein n=1 Tax=Hugenholtzia roseola TaxID=1002 RepID=UPI001378982A|nr:glycosyltransferase family 4 protein [Hugenholtzia roseola]